MKYLILTLISLALLACGDPNSKPTYGETGLPKNCRAIIQSSVNAYREAKRDSYDYEEVIYRTDDIMNSIENNCGSMGYSW